MVGASKILTVSYGTFSCTLEGFDDSFETMKAISEYFRDLAADDRYFGAEPATPDADMLARIAEREISKRVEAKVGDAGVVLRPTAIDKADAPAPVEAEPVVEPAPVHVEEVAQDVAEEAPVEVAKVPAALQTDLIDQENAPVAATSTLDAESVAAKLQRIRAVVSRADSDEPTYSEDQHAATPTDTDDQDDDFDINLFAEEQSTEEEAPVAEAEEDETDALIANIADEVAEIEDTEVAPSEVSEAERTESAASNTEVDDETDEVKADQTPVGENAISALLSRVADQAEDTPAVEKDTNDVEDEVLDLSAFVETDAPEIEVEPEIEEPEVAEVAEVAETPVDVEPESKSEPSAALARARARVVRVKRAALETAQEEDTVAELIDEAQAEQEEAKAEPRTVRPKRVKSSLSDEAEAELMRDLAAVEQEFATDTIDAAPSQPHGLGMDDEDQAVSRLMEETDQHLSDTDGSRRRSAISHLRAAVAAKQADDTLSDGSDDQDETETYREDLAKAVKPVSGDTDAPTRKLAPLVLVSEQRIDATPEQQPSERKVVRPRRVAASNLAIKEDFEVDVFDEDPQVAKSQTFAEYCEEMGAEGLPDVLEAAAAHCQFVMGLPHFSRPQVMKVAAESGEYSREDLLKSFGVLLRQNRIRKIKRGQFEVASNTRFRPH